MNNKWDDKDDVISQAAAWFVRIGGDEDWTSDEERAFERWFFDHPKHQEHQDALARQFHLHRLLCAGAPQLVEAWRPPKSQALPQPYSPRVLWKPLALAASVLAVVGLALWMSRNSGISTVTTFTTQTGESRLVRFADGSEAELNTRTRLEWTGHGLDRSVVLHEGQALFRVRHDSLRPFRVIVDESEIVVLGTEFDVYRRKRGDVSVTVISGAVEVRNHRASTGGWTRTIGANQQLVYELKGSKIKVASVEAKNVVSWRQGVLEIDDKPLSCALEELARYTEQKIRAPDPRVQQLSVGARVTTRDARAALARLEEILPVHVTETPDGFTLTYRDTKESTSTNNAETQSVQTPLDTRSYK